MTQNREELFFFRAQPCGVCTATPGRRPPIRPEGEVGGKGRANPVPAESAKDASKETAAPVVDRRGGRRDELRRVDTAGESKLRFASRSRDGR